MWLLCVVLRMKFGSVESCLISTSSRWTPQPSVNTAAIKWSSGGSRCVKNIYLKVCFVHEVVSMKHAILKYLPTAEQIANILT
jgi:hypothetical protein